MASYSELDEAGRNPVLRDKVRAAIAIAADTIRLESTGTANHAERLAWAQTAVTQISSELMKFMPLVLAANKTAALSAIVGASDTAIQSNVDALVDFFAV